MAITTHLKEADPNCKGLSGWVAFGQVYVVIGAKPGGGGTKDSDGGPLLGWVDTRNSLGDWSRQSIWRYIGRQYSGYVFQNEVTGQNKSIFPSYYRGYRLIKILFCGCSIGEIECVDCCVECCSVASEILTLLSK